MNVPRMILLVAVVLLLGHEFAFPSRAIAQHPAVASETARFAVLPVHSAGSVLAAAAARSEKMTVSFSRRPDGLHATTETALSQTLPASGCLPVPRARETSVIVTITE